MASGLNERLSSSELCDQLKKQIPSLSETILHQIEENKIDGEVFFSLDDESLRELAPLIGDRLKLRKLITSARETVSVRIQCYIRAPTLSLV